MNDFIKIITAAVILFGFCTGGNSAEYESSFDYIEKTSKLWGLSAVIVNKDNTITVVDRKKQGYGYALTLVRSKNDRADKMTLAPGEECLLSDFRHAFLTYKFIGFDNSNLIIEVTDKFDARSFGDEIKEETKRVVVIPYNED